MGKILLGKVALTPKGAFDAEREGGYARLDVVSSGTQSYVSLKDHNVSHLTDASAWMPYMSVELSGGGSGTTPTPTPTPSGQTRIDYSKKLEEGNFLISVRETYAVLTLSSGNTRRCLTKAIPVNIGDKIIFSGSNRGSYSTIVGYENENENSNLNGRTLNNATYLLGYGANGNTNTDEVSFSNETIEITSSTIKYVRCAGLATNSWKVELVKAGSSSGSDDNGGGEVTPQPQPIIVDSVPEPAGKAFCPDGKKIMICGASFSEDGNGWDKLLQDGTGISVVNKSQGGSNIRYMAENMIDASSLSKPHGTLFMDDGKDIFNEVGVLIIMYTHNDNVLLTEEAYKSRDVAWYKSHTSEATSSSCPLASSFDYVLKQIKEWCREYHTDSDVNLNQNLEIVNNQMQILICSNWHEGREYYNQSSRLLAIRHNVAYCPLDKELGFGADNLITDPSVTSKIDNHNGAVTRFNASILHGQHTTNNEPSDNGRVEYITDKDGNEVAWGWHPQRWTPTINTKSIDYGYGTATTWLEHTFAVPWIQRAIANSIIGHLNFNPVQEIG